jgi:hypothetical protein
VEKSRVAALTRRAESEARAAIVLAGPTPVQAWPRTCGSQWWLDPTSASTAACGRNGDLHGRCAMRSLETKGTQEGRNLAWAGPAGPARLSARGGSHRAAEAALGEEG